MEKTLKSLLLILPIIIISLLVIICLNGCKSLNDLPVREINNEQQVEASDETEIRVTTEETIKESKIIFTSEREGNKEIYIMNDDGSEQINLTGNPAEDTSPCFSPDSSKIAFSSNRDDGIFEIYVMDSDGSNLLKLTDNKSFNENQNPCWSPDGERIAFVSNSRIYIMDSDGKNQTRLTDDQLNEGNPCFSPDGSKIAFELEKGGLGGNIYIINADGSEQTKLVEDDPGGRGGLCFSPDGSKIAFSSPQWDGFEIFIMDVDGTGQVNITNNPDHDMLPCFSPDGSKIIFESNRDEHDYEIYIMNADGSGQTRITNTPGYDGDPCFLY